MNFIFKILKFKTIKNVFYDMNIVTAEKASNGNILIVIANTGKMEQSDFKVIVNEEEKSIIQGPNTLASGQFSMIEIASESLPINITVTGKNAQANHTLS